MRKKVYNNLHRLIALIVMVVLIFTVLFGIYYSPSVVYAATYVGENDYDSTSILEDLDGSVINGEEFNIKNFAFDTSKDMQVISFVEYCYSYYANQQGNYALYVYVWNPQGLDLAYNSTLNNIKLRFGDDTDTNYNSYDLYYCSRTSGDYLGLIYKFKVYLSSEDKEEIFSTLNSLSRKYWVSEVELKTEGDSGSTAYYVSTSYTYTGFAAGYGVNNTSESTLECVTQQEDTLSLDCGTAYYRPEGTTGEDIYTQDNLSSVYFAVPNSYIEKYGYLCALSAQWYEAMLYPILVTDNKTAYNNIYDYLGQDVSSICVTDDDFIYSALGQHSYTTGLSEALTTGHLMMSSCLYMYGMTSDFSYFDVGDLLTYGNTWIRISNYLSTLYSIYYASDYDGDRGVEIVSSSDIINMLSNATKANYESCELVADIYASYLFESYDTEARSYHVDTREGEEGYEYSSLDLRSNVYTSKTWWLNGATSYDVVSSETYDGIPALYALSDDDFTSEHSDSYNAEALYVSDADYADLKEYYDLYSSKTWYKDSSGTVYQTDGYTIYLLRFDVGEYSSCDANIYSKGSYSDEILWTLEESNSYFFQETVYLGFDIIDVTFTNGETDTTIGVVMSPIDIVYSSTSPINSGTDDGIDWAKIIGLILGLVLLVVLIVLFWPVFSVIIKAVVWVICLPFKLIGNLFNSKKKDKKNERKND